MRKSLAALALCLGLGMATPAMAQAPGASYWSGVNPRPVNIYPSNTTTFVQPRNLNSAFKQPTVARPFSLANIFHPVSLPSWPPRVGVSTTGTNVGSQIIMFPQQQAPSPVLQFFQTVGNVLSPY
jgi:hypothetical protein